jgi:hypothetical protein
MAGELDPLSILRAIKRASSFDIFLISFVALPFVFNAWLGIAEKLAFSEKTKVWLMLPVLLLYVVGMILTFLGNSQIRRREVARDQVIGYLASKGFNMVSFERIRLNINKALSDEFLDTLPVYFPDAVRKARLKDGVPGLARIESSETRDEG